MTGGNSMESCEDLIHKLRQAADIQKEVGDLLLADLLQQAALKLRILEARLEEVRRVVER